MQNFHVKSIFLGVGIGIVMTSIISMIFFAGLEPRLNKEEIIKQAEKYGMVQSSGASKSEPASSTTKEDAKKQNEGIKLNDTKEMPTPSATPFATAIQQPSEQDAVIVVNKGDSSEIVGEKVAKAGLISNESAFIKEVSALGLSNDINIGEYKIKKGTEIGEIIKALTKHK